MTIIHLNLPARPVTDEHHCVAKYRAADGRYTRCWCGADTRGEVVDLRERRQAEMQLPADCEDGGTAA